MKGNNSTLSEKLDIIKVYTILLVVLGHVLRMYTAEGAFPHQGTWVTEQMCSMIYSFHMPLFIFISGCIYGICKRKGKYASWKNLLSNKVKRIIYPYLSFGLLVLAPCMVYTNLSDNYITYCIKDLFGGGNIRHLWYLLSLFQMYVIAHFLRNVLNRQNWVIVFITIMLFVLIYRYATHFNALQLRMTISYIPYFILGYYVGDDSFRMNMSNLRASILLLTSVIVWGLKYRLPAISVLATEYIVAFLLILAILHFSGKVHSMGNVGKLILKNGMGIYLWHVVILYLAYYYDLFASAGLYLQICLMTIISLVLSVILTYFTRRMHLLFLLGESK